MEHNSQSYYRLLSSYILLTQSVLNPINQDLKSIGHAIVFANHPTDWNARWGQPAKKERFIKHGLDNKSSILYFLVRFRNLKISYK